MELRNSQNHNSHLIFQQFLEAKLPVSVYQDLKTVLTETFWEQEEKANIRNSALKDNQESDQ